MKNLNIGSIKIPINAATKTCAILGKRGAGKTYNAGVFAEEYFKNDIPFVVFDPIDVWWGLRLNKDGKSKGLPVVVFGIQNADIPLTREMGRQIAQEIVKENISCVISTFGMPKVGMRHLIAEFAEELLNINNTPRHVFIEEAHEFVPQRVQGAGAKCFSAVEALVTMGRNKGIGVTLINQRAATVNKDVLTQLDTLLALRSVGPQDRKALQEWVEYHAAEGDFNKFLNSLPSLPTGEAWIWSPEFMGVFERVKIRARETFHPDREKLGDKFEMPKLGSADVESFISKFKASIEAPKKEEVKKELPKTATEILIPETHKIDLRNLKNDYESRLIDKDSKIRDLTSIVTRLNNVIQKIRDVVRSDDDDVYTESTPIPSVNGSAVSMWLQKLGNGGPNRILQFLADNSQSSFTRQQIALAIQASYSSVKDAWVPLLKRNLLVKEEGGKLKINPDL